MSGLVCAEKLSAAQRSVTVLEARDRVGGRLLSQQGVDLGASWRWPGMDSRSSSIAKRLGVAEVPQQLSGTAYVAQGGRAQAIGNSGARMAPCGPGAMRFSGGYQSLPLGLQAESTATIQLGCQVTSITQGPESIKITYEGADGTTSIDARRVVLALPSGVLASTIAFEPPLPEKQLQKMRSTATWCGDWCKVVATFKTAFWREHGESGVVATQDLPIQIWWEGGAGPTEGDAACALVGLGVGEDVCGKMAELGRPGSEAKLRNFVSAALSPAFGDVVERELLECTVKSWATEPQTYAKGGSHRDYGHALLKKPLPWGVHFAGTETESENGHVEGAVRAGERAAQEVLASLG